MCRERAAEAERSVPFWSGSGSSSSQFGKRKDVQVWVFEPGHEVAVRRGPNILMVLVEALVAKEARTPVAQFGNRRP